MTAGCLKTPCSLGSFLTYLMRFLSVINTTLKVRRHQVALQSRFSFLMSLSTSTDTLIMAAGIPQSSFELSSSHSLLMYSEGLVTTTDHQKDATELSFPLSTSTLHSCLTMLKLLILPVHCLCTSLSDLRMNASRDLVMLFASSSAGFVLTCSNF